MARTSVTDPLRNFKFRVTIKPESGSGLETLVGGGTSNAFQVGFSVVSGISVQNEMIAYREGGMNTHPHKMVGQSDYGPVTFTRGVFPDQDALWKWQQFLHQWSGGGLGDDGQTNNDYRCNISVRIYDHPTSDEQYNKYPNVAGSENISETKVKLGYHLYNCWPSSYALGDLNAGDSSILIQQLVVHHEGFEMFWGNDVSNIDSFA